MIKVILFDCDGLIIKHAKHFSQRLKEQKGIDVNSEGEKAFFKNEFLLCEIGKADLKNELTKRLAIWGWKGTVAELMQFWFSGEADIVEEMKEYILSLRKQGIKCFLSTNNEKYRTEYLANTVDLKSFLDGIFSSAYLGYLKPQIKYWAEAYKSLSGTPKDQILIWDDILSAVDSAGEFGFNAEHYQNFEGFKKIMEGKYQIVV
jgi:putative hydrolase of the HAD superfamily